jgi:mannose-6-phosphate isomerase-like protein (cupin superfamily)
VTVSDEIKVLRAGRDYTPLGGAGDVRALVWPGMGARFRSLHLIRLGPGEASDRWQHPHEAVYYVLAGSGRARDHAAGVDHELQAGLIVHIEARTPYTLEARDALVCVGGPCPPDLALYERRPGRVPEDRR